MINWFRRKRRGGTEGPESDTAAHGAEHEQEDDAADSSDRALVLEEAEPVPPSEVNEPEDVTPDNTDMETAVEESSDADGHPPRQRLVGRLRARLRKTRERLVDRLDRLMMGKKTLDVDLLDELEEILITSDLGVRTTRRLLESVTERIQRKELGDADILRKHLREDIRNVLSLDAPPWEIGEKRPFVIMAVGVNGVGKTTTVGKLAHRLKQEGRSVLLVAADTFRAAAVEQLILWGERAHVPVVHQKSGSDPSAVAFDAIEAALARNVDVVLLDTAGRMHTKSNLMEELKKIQRVIGKKLPGAPHEILLVLDATTGQNALSQARLFKEGVGVTGLILTKLDGTAKGGIITAICEETGIPVRYIGIGEAVEDLRPFDADEFTQALF